jgi:hypothetical protein
MKTMSVCIISLVLASASFAQDKSTAAKQGKEVQQETKTVPGKIISTKSFDLDDKNTTVNVAPTVKTGGWVSVVEKTDSNGHKTVTVKPSSQKRAKTTS